MKPVLRLLADDLTGALDSAAEFAGLCGAVPVPRGGTVQAGSAALDTATREAPREVAVERVTQAAPLLSGADIAFKKLDSLLRGHPMAELAACLRGGIWRSVVLAPAFPAQDRVTRGGSQWALRDGAWRPVAAPLAELLAAEGLEAIPGDAARPLPRGIAVFDAATEEEMARIVACGRAAPGPVLWCGSGGLARALAAEAPAPVDRALRGPVLGLFGSDQGTTLRQLAACGPLWLRLAEDEGAGRLAAHLQRDGAALVSADLPAGMDRAVAAERIAKLFAALIARLPAPGALLVAGGATLAGLCDALGATALATRGLVGPGVPRSVLRGGRWDGVEVISKSGAFGEDGLWRDLLAANGFIADRLTA